MRGTVSALRLECTTGVINMCTNARMCCRRDGVDDPEHWLDAVEQLTELPVGTDSRSVWAQLRVPDSQTRRRWDLAVYALVIYTLFYFSFSSAFAVSFGLGGRLAIEFSIDFAFLLDVALNSQSFFYLYSGDLCTDPAQMRRNCLTRGMFFDIIGILPAPVELGLLLLGDDASLHARQRAFRLVRLLRLVRVSKLPRFEKCHYTYLPGLRVVQLFLSFYAVVHVIACVMYLLFAVRPESLAGDAATVLSGPSSLAVLTTEQDGRWLNDDIVASSTSERYIDALYVALLIMVGEDSYPVTSWQRAFVVCTMIFGACFYATVVGSVAVLVKNTDVQTSIYYEHMDALNSKMEIMALPKSLRRRVASYYAFVWKRLRKFSTEHGEFQLNVDSFIQELPLLLREEIALFLHKSMVQKVNMPNELIIDVGGVGDRMFFVSSGAIEIFAASGRLLRILNSGDYMGEFALITGEPRSAMAVAKTFVLLHVLLKADFDRIMRAWPEYETRMAEACEKRLMSAAVLPTESQQTSVNYRTVETELNQQEITTSKTHERHQHKASDDKASNNYPDRYTPHQKQHRGNECRQSQEQQLHAETPTVHKESNTQRSESLVSVCDSTIVVDNDVMKDVKAIRTILAKRNGMPSTADDCVSSDVCVSNSCTRSLEQQEPKSQGTGCSGLRYHFQQPNEPQSEQWVNDGSGRRSQGDRFARGHSARFTELQPPPTSRFSSTRQGSCAESTTGRFVGRKSISPDHDGISSRRGGRLLGEMGGNGTMPLLSTATDGALAAKLESVGRNHETLTQRMEEIQAMLELIALPRHLPHSATSTNQPEDTSVCV